MNVFQYTFMFIIVCAGIIFLIMYAMQKSVLALTYTFETFDTGSNEGNNGSNGSNEGRIGIVSMMKNPKNMEHWLQHHRDMGVAHFYIRLEESPEWEAYLNEQPDVTLFVGKSTGINEYEEKQVRQTNFVNLALKQALQSGSLDWLIQIDSDELLSGDLDEVRDLPESVRTCWMNNVEAVYEGVPGKNDSCFQAAKFRECSKGHDGCVSYANGKGGGRVAPDVSSFGSHRFKSGNKGSGRDKEGSGRDKEGHKEVQLKRLLVQHFESCDYDLYKEKYTQLSNTDTQIDIPFSYYHESIRAAEVANITGNEDALQCVYTKHRTVLGNSSDDCF